MTVANVRTDVRRKARTRFAALLMCSLFFYSCQISASSSKDSNPDQSIPHCAQTKVSEDVLVVLRTGATEVLEKLQVHLDTTLRCIPKYIIYSDYEEDIKGHQVYDVFDELSQDLKDSTQDFALHHQLKAKGRAGLTAQGIEHDGSGSTGLLSNPGWKLDKFKFLPMLDKALRHSPHTKWFVFIELDTYLLWTNLLDYLSRLDSEHPYYIGKQMYIGGVLFAHGGSGFALSAAAMRSATAHWRANMATYNRFTIEQWAGDMVLGKLMADVGIPLLWAFPHFQGDPVSTLDHNITKAGRRPWCYPALTYHHMSGDEIRALWSFEQDWRRAKPGDAVLRHADVFKGYVQPRLRAEKTEWDNYSVSSAFSEWALEGKGKPDTIEACTEACASTTACLQFSFHAPTCLLSNEIRLGRAVTAQCEEYSLPASKCERTNDYSAMKNEGSAAVVSSGWSIERVGAYVDAMDKTCGEGKEWIVS